MSRNPNAELSNFFVTGINYKKTDTAIRGSFAIGPEQYENMLQMAGQYGVRDLFVLSTCNRSEIYAIADNPQQLVNLFCSQTQGAEELFQRTVLLQKREACTGTFIRCRGRSGFPDFG